MMSKRGITAVILFLMLMLTRMIVARPTYPPGCDSYDERRGEGPNLILAQMVAGSDEQCRGKCTESVHCGAYDFRAIESDEIQQISVCYLYLANQEVVDTLPLEILANGQSFGSGVWTPKLCPVSFGDYYHTCDNYTLVSAFSHISGDWIIIHGKQIFQFNRPPNRAPCEELCTLHDDCKSYSLGVLSLSAYQCWLYNTTIAELRATNRSQHILTNQQSQFRSVETFDRRCGVLPYQVNMTVCQRNRTIDAPTVTADDDSGNLANEVLCYLQLGPTPDSTVQLVGAVLEVSEQAMVGDLSAHDLRTAVRALEAMVGYRYNDTTAPVNGTEVQNLALAWSNLLSPGMTSLWEEEGGPTEDDDDEKETRVSSSRVMQLLEMYVTVIAGRFVGDVQSKNLRMEVQTLADVTSDVQLPSLPDDDLSPASANSTWPRDSGITISHSTIRNLIDSGVLQGDKNYLASVQYNTIHGVLSPQAQIVNETLEEEYYVDEEEDIKDGPRLIDPGPIELPSPPIEENSEPRPARAVSRFSEDDDWQEVRLGEAAAAAGDDVDDQEAWQINSRVIQGSFALPSRPGPQPLTLEPPILVEFTHLQAGLPNPACVSWMFTSPHNGGGHWTNVGCRLLSTNSTHSACQCNHMTNYALLTSVSPDTVPTNHDTILHYITVIGCTLSILAMVATIIIYTLLWKHPGIGGSPAKLLVNICLSLTIAMIILLLAFEKERVESEVACSVVAALLHYFYLVAFCVMLSQGLFVFALSAYPLNRDTHKRIIKHLLIGSWVCPLIIVGISLAATQTRGYGDHTVCWLSMENFVRLAFLIPALLIILVNLVLLILTLKIVLFRQRPGVAAAEKSDKNYLRRLTWNLCVLVPILGLPWVFGVFAASNDLIVFQYLFVIFNSLQGVFIFNMHCVMNDKVHAAIRHQQRRYHVNRRKSSGAATADGTTSSSSAGRKSSSQDTNLTPLRSNSDT